MLMALLKVFRKTDREKGIPVSRTYFNAVCDSDHGGLQTDSPVGVAPGNYSS